MENIGLSVRKVFQNAGRAFTNYPVVLGSALIYVVAFAVSLNLDYGIERQQYDLLLSSIWLATALGAAFGLAAITRSRTRKGTSSSFRTANILTAGVGILVFIILYFFSGVQAENPYSGTAAVYQVLHPLATYRVLAAIAVSILAFLLFASHPDEDRDFSRSLIMTIKAFFQGLLFGIVSYLGAAAVVIAIDSLITRVPQNMYGYIAAFSGFLGFAILVGYFPDFKKGAEDDKLVAAREKPRFLEVLLDYILVPVMLAFTLVLLLWALLTIFSGMNTNFTTLYSISTGYAAAGLILHVLVTHSETGIARLYRKVFPLAVLPILAFEAWALILQVNQTGIRTMEYLFILGWIVTLNAAVLLILRQYKAHPLIVYVISGALIFAVLPLVGFGELPVITQMSRLERLLLSQDMLQNEQIVPGSEEIPENVREDISKTVDYLAFVPYAEYPEWFDKEALRTNDFERIMGFRNTVSQPGYSDAYWNLQMIPNSQVIDVRDYQWNVLAGGRGDPFMDSATFTGEKGQYTVVWESDGKQGIPTMTMLLNDEPILEEDFLGFIDEVKAIYPAGRSDPSEQTSDKLNWYLETDEVELVFIIRLLQITGTEQEPYYYLDIAGVLVSEKP